ncbi:MAG: LCP family protein [Anaerolineales bacterium]|nr:LCP family protein [Anaerolineales bacterium]
MSERTKINIPVDPAVDVTQVSRTTVQEIEEAEQGAQVPPGPIQAPPPLKPPAQRTRRWSWCGCGCLLPILAIFVLMAAYFLLPGRTNVLALGVDSREPGSDLGRTDTIVLVTIQPSSPYVGMLSIPRDLWVEIPGIGPNRINTAHFFAEAENPGSGPDAAMETITYNFGVPVNRYIRVGFDGLPAFVDALGGVTITIDQPTAILPAGTHTLNGEQALAFVRDRQGSDDFFRMERGQAFLIAVTREMLSPLNWPKIPDVMRALPDLVDTNVPVWLWPRLGLAVVRVGLDGLENQVISRDMVNPFTTGGGAAVLAPNWDLINPLVEEMFGT